MSLIKNFNIQDNFWEYNQQLSIIGSISELYNKDKSPHKQDSSKIMWAIVMLIDINSSNKYRTLSEEDRKKLIITDYLKNPKFKWEDYKDIINDYKKLALSPEERRLMEHDIKMEERSTFIKNTKYSLDTANLLDNMEKNRVLLGKIRKELVELATEKDGNSMSVRGDKKLSAREQGII